MSRSPSIVFALFTLCLLAPVAADGQVCGTPACHSDETLRSDGYCEHDSGFPTYAKSHRANDCTPDAPLNAASGLCAPRGGCGGGGSGLCREHPVCSPGQTYRDSGCYDSCAPLAPCSHTRAECEAGWTLDTGRGVCRLCRIPPVGGGGSPIRLRPDLTFRSAPTLSVKPLVVGHKYAICFTVANIGALAAGPFRVAGGGLGIPVAPYRDFPGLAAGATASGCLAYPTTPSVGSYTVGLTVDSLNAVTELREDNNTANVSVTVVP